MKDGTGNTFILYWEGIAMGVGKGGQSPFKFQRGG